MGRPSKLTPAQWEDVDRRLLSGESASALAKEYGVAISQISRRFSQISQVPVRNAAEKLVEARQAMAALPAAHQRLAESLAQKLQNISSSLACAAELGAKTAHRLAALANDQVGKVDDADPLSNIDDLKSVGVLTKLSNDSASIALGLLAANRAKANERQTEFGLPDTGIDLSDAERAALQAAVHSLTQ